MGILTSPTIFLDTRSVFCYALLSIQEEFCDSMKTSLQQFTKLHKDVGNRKVSKREAPRLRSQTPCGAPCVVEARQMSDLARLHLKETGCF